MINKINTKRIAKLAALRALLLALVAVILIALFTAAGWMSILWGALAGIVIFGVLMLRERTIEITQYDVFDVLHTDRGTTRKDLVAAFVNRMRLDGWWYRLDDYQLSILLLELEDSKDIRSERDGQAVVYFRNFKTTEKFDS